MRCISIWKIDSIVCIVSGPPRPTTFDPSCVTLGATFRKKPEHNPPDEIGLYIYYINIKKGGEKSGARAWNKNNTVVGERLVRYNPARHSQPSLLSFFLFTTSQLETVGPRSSQFPAHAHFSHLLPASVLYIVRSVSNLLIAIRWCRPACHSSARRETRTNKFGRKVGRSRVWQEDGTRKARYTPLWAQFALASVAGGQDEGPAAAANLTRTTWICCFSSPLSFLYVCCPY